MVDIPGHRSSHAQITPRGAGLAPLVAIIVVLAVVAYAGIELPSLWFFVASGLMALVGLADDMFGGVPPAVRLVLQCAIAIGYVLLAGGLQTLPVPGLTSVNLGLAALPLTVLWLVAVPNIYNFLDGIDGLATSQAVICGVAIAVLGGGGGVSILGGVIAGAGLGFLPHNWQPAKMFMGDVGSLTFGFMFAAAPFELGLANASTALIAISLCLWFFLADGAYTVVRRLFTGEKIWQAHRTHLYQRLVRTGLSHADVTIGVMLTQSMIASFAVASVVLYPGDSRPLGLTFAVSLILFEAYRGLTSRKERRLSTVSPTSGSSGLAPEDSAVKGDPD
jgi:UDP-N-acetylmuramyl pentapeptide phosphotransferase/UDP-N-acetylglucosamine-1-phosphate transferase